MDIGRTRAQATTMGTMGEKERQRSEGRCYRCNRVGHILRYCPQRNEGSTSTIAATVAINSPNPLFNQQRAQAYLATLHNEPEEVRNAFVDKLFAEKKDFLNA